MAQALLFALSLTAAFCVNDHRDAVKKWGPVFGLLSQPLWLYETLAAAQWGMVALACVYTGLWARGYYNAWWRVA